MEVEIGPLSAIPPGEGRNFQTGALRVAVFHTRGGDVYAVQAECPHRGGPLADGLVGGSTVICPLHSWKFDLATGRVLMGECGLKRYEARVSRFGQVLLTID
ncbi:MAG TPA: Rieske 2Fe-2S domain-containing protein [Bryobacteraceae bacterium]|nr:Rieske 2Fe-2S domain-containing protein [Bryobacteraceae bacterium]